MKVSAAINRLLGSITSNRLVSAVSSNRIVAAIAVGLFIIIRRFTDSSFASDSQSISSGKGLSDTSVTSDSYLFDTTKQLSDSVYVTDDLDGNASIEDDQEMSFVKVTRERVSGIADNAVLLAGKSYSDSSIGSDSGSSLKQDYVNDPFYFADDYVGTKATF